MRAAFLRSSSSAACWSPLKSWCTRSLFTSISVQHRNVCMCTAALVNTQWTTFSSQTQRLQHLGRRIHFTWQRRMCVGGYDWENHEAYVSFTAAAWKCLYASSHLCALLSSPFVYFHPSGLANLFLFFFFAPSGPLRHLLPVNYKKKNKSPHLKFNFFWIYHFCSFMDTVPILP